MNKFIVFLFLPLLFYSCHKNSINKAYILKRFTPEEINFFWETGCYLNSEKETRINDNEFSINKRKDDIHIRTYGELSPIDSAGIENAINELNSLDLPIKAYWNRDTMRFHNYEIYFAEASILRQIFSDKIPEGYELPDNFNDIRFLQRKRYMHKVYIGIVKNPDYEKNVSFMLLYDLLSSIGLGGNSFSHLESVLYYSPLNNQTALSEIDKAALRLLYSPAIHSGTNRVDFLNAFSSILHSRTITNNDYDAFESYIKKQKFSEESIRNFLLLAFKISPNNDEFYISKWKTRPIIHFESDSLKRLSENMLKAGVDSINTYLPEELKICFASLNQPYNVLVSGQNGWSDEQYAQTGIQITAAAIPIKKIEDDEKLQKQEGINSILELLGIHRQVIVSTTGERFTKKHSAEFIKLYLSPVVKSGMKKDKIVEILRKYYDLKTINKIDYDRLESYLSKKPLSDSSMLYVKNIIESRPFTSKMEPVRIGLSEQAEKDSAIVNSLCNSLAPIVDMRLSSRDSCNIFINYSSEDFVKIVSSNDLSGQCFYIATAIPETYSSSGQYNRLADYILSNIFTCSIDTGIVHRIATADGMTFTFEPYWLEALEFYYSPYIQSGMKKEKVMEIILKYYPNIILN